MDQTTMLIIAFVALAIVVTAWATREIMGRVGGRRRGLWLGPEPDVDPTVAGAPSELVPLLLQPIAALVRNIGRHRTSIDSLVGPDGTVSLMFSDIEGSTALNHRLGDDEWVRLINAHDEIVDRAVRRHDGLIVKTQGDGFMAAFRTPEDAVGAAVSLGPDLRASDTVGVPLALRVGVHTGEVVSEKGDLFGTNVAMAARIGDVASGNQVLVSDAVREQLRDTEGLAFRRHRKVRLKGLPGRHRVHAVMAEPHR